MSDEFQQPLRGDKFEAEQFDGALLLFYPFEYHSAIPTEYGDSAVVDTHIVALDRPDLTGQPTVLRDARIFGRAMVPQLKGAVGGKAVLGRLGRGQNTKGNPPWVLKDFSEADAAFSRQYMSTHPDPRTTPAQPQPSAPPTSNGYAPPATAIGSPAVPTQYGVPVPVPPPPPPGQYQPAAHVQPPTPGIPAPQQTMPAPTPAAPTAPARDPGMVAYLKSRGVDVDRLPAEADLNLIAANLG